MTLHRPSELRRFLDSLGVRARKSLSQHFLIDGNIIRNIVKTAAISSQDTILEIGAGPGALTEAFLATGAHVIAVEKDPAFAAALNRFPSLKVFAGDIFDFPLDTLHGKVVANPPYQLLTPLLALLLPRHDLFSTLTLVVQEEMARRLCAQPQTKDYSSLTLFAHFYATPHYAFPVSRRCFYPTPNVDSAVVSLTLRKPPELPSTPAFFALVKTAFGQRRKMLRSSLKTLYPQITSDPFASQRPEALSLQDFLTLFTRLNR